MERAKALSDEDIKRFKKSQYYLNLTTDQQIDILFPYRTDFPSLIDDAIAFEPYGDVLSGESVYNKLIEVVRKVNPDSYVLGYISEHPSLRDSLKIEYLNYQCRYSYTDFILEYIAGTLDKSKGSCRDEAWHKYCNYYNSRDAFEKDYSNGVDIENRFIAWTKYGSCYKSRRDFEADFAKGVDMEGRFTAWSIYRVYYKSIDDFIEDYTLGVNMESLCNDIRNIQKELNSTYKMPNGVEEIPVNSLKLNKSDNPYAPEPVKNIVRNYYKLQYYPSFQEKAAEIIIKKNYYVKKEYDKTGKYFSSKRQFVTAYFSTNYKNLLREAKKK